MTTKQRDIRPGAIPALTGLRFIAALLVLFAHALPKIIPVNNADAPLYFYAHGTALIGMPLFFVLSGFVIQYNYALQIRTQGVAGTYNFIVARFARLYPLFLVCLLFDLIIKWSYQSLPAQTSDALPYYLTLTHSWLYDAYDKNSLTFIFGWMPQVSWSISTEWFFYLCFPLICFALHKVHSIRVLAFIFTALSVLAFMAAFLLALAKPHINAIAVAHFGALADYYSATNSQSFYEWLLIFSPYPRLFEFTLGCMAAKVYALTAHNTPSPREQKRALVATLIAIGAIVAILLFLCRPDFTPSGPYTFIGELKYIVGFAIPISALIFCCARYSNAITRALSKKYMLLCGEISFSIYMLHMLIIAAFRWEAATATTWEIGVSGILRLIVVIATTIGLSLVTYTLIEMPAKKWLTRKLSYRPKPDEKPL